MACQWKVEHWSIKMIHRRSDKKGDQPSNLIGLVLHDYWVDFNKLGCFSYLNFSATTKISTFRRWNVKHPMVQFIYMYEPDNIETWWEPHEKVIVKMRFCKIIDNLSTKC